MIEKHLNIVHYEDENEKYLTKADRRIETANRK